VYSAVWITCDTTLHKFQRCYKLAAPLPDENYDMSFEQLELLSKLCVSGIGNISIGLKKVLPVVGNWFIISKILYELALTLKEALT
jgi:hypothetical protein